MVIAYKYRLYPTAEQTEYFSKVFDGCRYVYNTYLQKRKELYETKKETLGFYDCAKDLTQLKKSQDWLKEVDSMALQASLRDLDAAYKKFFREKKGYPRFKSRYDHRKSFRTIGRNIHFKDDHIKLPKVGWVKYRGGRDYQGRILNATVSLEPSGKYFVSLCCTNVDIDQFQRIGNKVTVALDTDSIDVLVDGRSVGVPRFKESQSKKLASLQRNLSRKKKGGANYEKARIKLARAHESVANQRKDFLNKFTTKLVEENDIIYVDDVKVHTFMKDTASANALNDLGWNEMVRQITYKCEWYGKKLVLQSDAPAEDAS